MEKWEAGWQTQRQQEYIGASDETWQQVVIIFAAASRFVLMIPGWTDGVVNEMEILGSSKWETRDGSMRIKSDSGQLSSRTIVLMPRSRGSADRNGLALEWNRVKERCARFGFNIPYYDDRGMLYIPNPDFSIRFCFMLPTAWYGNSDADAVVLGIQKLLPMIAGKYGTFADALKSAEDTFGITFIHRS